jgi:hypothetical protein
VSWRYLFIEWSKKHASYAVIILCWQPVELEESKRESDWLLDGKPAPSFCKSIRIRPGGIQIMTVTFHQSHQPASPIPANQLA